MVEAQRFDHERSDVILKITRVRVRETVPDSAFEAADEIVLIDLPPEELLKRLAAGKVYFQETAAHARERFFKPQNLDALRELALRAAERIDTDLVQRMQAGAIEGPLPASERYELPVHDVRSVRQKLGHLPRGGEAPGMRGVDPQPTVSMTWFLCVSSLARRRDSVGRSARPYRSPLVQG